MSEGEPAEAEEDFQYALIKVLKRMNKNLENINANLEEMKKKIAEEESLH
jgi:hypothetical protein